MKRPAKITVILATALLFCCIALVPLGKRGTRNWLGSSSFGKMPIKLADGSQVYVVRESWGRHTDEVSVRRD
jgi:hypothetical protein